MNELANKRHESELLIKKIDEFLKENPISIRSNNNLWKDNHGDLHDYARESLIKNFLQKNPNMDENKVREATDNLHLSTDPNDENKHQIGLEGIDLPPMDKPEDLYHDSKYGFSKSKHILDHVFSGKPLSDNFNHAEQRLIKEHLDSGFKDELIKKQQELHDHLRSHGAVQKDDEGNEYLNLTKPTFNNQKDYDKIEHYTDRFHDQFKHMDHVSHKIPLNKVLFSHAHQGYGNNNNSFIVAPHDKIEADHESVKPLHYRKDRGSEHGIDDKTDPLLKIKNNVKVTTQEFNHAIDNPHKDINFHSYLQKHGATDSDLAKLASKTKDHNYIKHMSDKGKSDFINKIHTEDSHKYSNDFKINSLNHAQPDNFETVNNHWKGLRNSSEKNLINNLGKNDYHKNHDTYQKHIGLHNTAVSKMNEKFQTQDDSGGIEEQ